MQTYTIRKTAPVSLACADFAAAETGRILNVRPESVQPVPEVTFRALHDGSALYVRFDVKDHFVRSVQTAFQSPVCTDSCVEFFVQPKAGKGYFNLEINAGGTLLFTYVEDPTRTPAGLAKCTPMVDDACRQVEIISSLPRIVEPERTGLTEWTLRYRVPFTLFEPFIGEVDTAVTWRGNFYKCGDKTSHPHWLSWSPVSALNFHLPQCFGILAFS
jgi:hypothetical protein